MLLAALGSSQEMHLNLLSRVSALCIGKALLSVLLPCELRAEPKVQAQGPGHKALTAVPSPL
jgi:hypothetical protein